MKKPEAFEYIKTNIRRDWLIEDLKRDVDSYRDKVLICIKEYKHAKEKYNKAVSKDKEIIEYLEYLEDLADSVQ